VVVTMVGLRIMEVAVAVMITVVEVVTTVIVTMVTTVEVRPVVSLCFAVNALLDF